MEVSVSLLLLLAFVLGIAIGTVIVVILSIYCMSEEL